MIDMILVFFSSELVLKLVLDISMRSMESIAALSPYVMHHVCNCVIHSFCPFHTLLMTFHD